ncbi:MAG: Uma2 family endonuclease [Actinomycetota bacterium]
MRAGPIRKHDFSVEEFERMGTAGVFGPESRLELIEGEVVELGPIGLAHAGCVRKLNRLLSQSLGDRALVDVQNPLVLSDATQVQPDIAVLAPRADAYSTAHPGPADVALLVEVSDTTLAYDRSVKVLLYATAGVREVWVVDIAGRAVEVYTDPDPDGYRSVSRVGAGEEVSPKAFEGLQISVNALLP